MSEQSTQSGCFGKKIRQLRENQGLSQEKFAIKLQLLGWDICRSTYAKIEEGKRALTPAELKIIAQVCGVPVEELLKME